MNIHYKLEGKTVTPCDGFQGVTQIEKTELADCFVSTIFTGLNLSLLGPPMVFETMIFGGKHDEYCRRTATYDEAMAEHSATVTIAQS